MKIIIKYSKKSNLFIGKINNFLFISFSIRRPLNKNLLINISLVTYNYILLTRIIRQFGLAKPLINIKDYYL